MNINCILFLFIVANFISSSLFTQQPIQTQPQATLPVQGAYSQPASPTVAPAVPVVTPVQAAPFPQPQAIVPATTSSVAISGNDNDFEEVNKNLTETVAIKKVLKDLVKDINDKLLNARKKVLNAQKLSFDVLQKTQAEAEHLVAQISADLQDMHALQTFIQSDLVPKFDSNVKQVEELIKKIQSKMNELQSKGFKFQMSQAQSPMQAKVQTTQDIVALPQTQPEASVASQFAPQAIDANQAHDKAFYSRAWDWATKQVVSAVNFVKSSWNQK